MPFVGVNLGGQRRRVADLDGDLAAPFRLQRRDVDDDAATGVRRFAQTGGQDVARNLEVLHRLGQGEAIRRNDADSRLRCRRRRWELKFFGSIERPVDIGEDLEISADADVVAVAGNAEGNDAGPRRFLGKGNDLDVAFDLPVGQKSHRELQKSGQWSVVSVSVRPGITGHYSSWLAAAFNISSILSFGQPDGKILRRRTKHVWHRWIRRASRSRADSC